MNSIINDLRSANKDKSKSKERLNDSDIDKKMKIFKTINGHQQTLETISKIDRSGMSEINYTNPKSHRKYESHHNMESLLPKKKDFDNNTKTFVKINKAFNKIFL